VESFFKAKPGGLSPIEEIIGEEITRDNTIIYICGYQGTIDGVLEYMKPKGFVTEHDKREDGSFEIKYESYG
jgi:ferredoxin--NADP+ reductase